MTFEYYQKSFTERAVNAGYTHDNIIKCLKYAEPLIKKNLPVIFNTSNLSVLVGYRKNFIKKAVLFPDYFYRSFEIPKKNGSSRKIKEPLPSLKEIQYWILYNVLYELPVSRFAKAYIPERNIFDNVKYHKNRNIVMTLDIENFFTSIKRPHVEALFLGLGYSSNISNLLSKLCCLDNSLPQGTPTSPYLSNLYMNSFDTIVADYCKLCSIRYTRYADDLTFSGDFEPESIIKYVTAELSKIDLVLNSQKIKIMRKNVRQLVTGVVVNKKMQIPKEKRNKIRQEIYFIKKLGIENHLINTNNKRANYLQHLLGRLNFVLYINPLDTEMKENYEYIKTFLNTDNSTGTGVPLDHP